MIEVVIAHEPAVARRVHVRSPILRASFDAPPMRATAGAAEPAHATPAAPAARMATQPVVLRPATPGGTRSCRACLRYARSASVCCVENRVASSTDFARCSSVTATKGIVCDMAVSARVSASFLSSRRRMRCANSCSSMSTPFWRWLCENSIVCRKGAGARACGDLHSPTACAARPCAAPSRRPRCSGQSARAPGAGRRPRCSLRAGLFQQAGVSEVRSVDRAANAGARVMGGAEAVADGRASRGFVCEVDRGAQSGFFCPLERDKTAQTICGAL